MDPTRLRFLLNEAEALGIHAARAGKLPEDSRIFEVIHSMTQALERGDNPPEASLFAEMSKASRAAGVTVAQLLHRETLLGRLRRRAALATPFLIGFMTLLLTLYLAFQSSELHKADLALREYQDLVSQRLQEKFYLAWRMYKYERVLDVKAPPLAQLDNYQKLVEDAHRLNAKTSAVLGLLEDSSTIRYVPDLFASHGWCWLQNLASILNGIDPSQACRTAPLPVENEDKRLQQVSPDLDIACKTQSLPAATANSVRLETKIDPDEYLRSLACFVRSIGITDDLSTYPQDPAIYATRNKVNLLVSWLLPGLYGLLGACVYVMRDLLRENGQSKAGGDARIVDLLSLLLRVALGGLAGIIIGWFWVPNTPTGSSAAISISSIPFGMAFLAGFSIETLFSLLDRLNKTVGKYDENIPADVTKDPEGRRERRGTFAAAPPGGPIEPTAQL
jgi:hypothetical protein